MSNTPGTASERPLSDATSDWLYCLWHIKSFFELKRPWNILKSTKVGRFFFRLTQKKRWKITEIKKNTEVMTLQPTFWYLNRSFESSRGCIGRQLFWFCLLGDLLKHETPVFHQTCGPACWGPLIFATRTVFVWHKHQGEAAERCQPRVSSCTSIWLHIYARA